MSCAGQARAGHVEFDPTENAPTLKVGNELVAIGGGIVTMRGLRPGNHVAKDCTHAGNETDRR